MKKKAIPEELKDKKREYIHMLEMDHQNFVNRRVSKQLDGLPKLKKKIPQTNEGGSCCWLFGSRSRKDPKKASNKEKKAKDKTPNK